MSGVTVTSIISWSPAVMAGVVAGDGNLSAPRQIGIPSFRHRRVPRWKGFSFRNLAMWAVKGPEMYAVTKLSPRGNDA